ncbi:MAG: uncharacterized protein JWN03_5717 [Nocardia sp.]|uniref:bifunctional DNA primase/polymerase n=1 Tax=Nocardia sp. TaxID=1821 RepID=UPI002610AEF2|nr:bifunctional DNA primase/polymerase [Nocardia sp.]MCU1645442.1 uncharacterized protein [Nocardia sp.]
MLPTALANAERGFHIFPLHAYSKLPAITDWENQASRDPDRIRAWWTRGPALNVAIACGPSQLLVLDLDAAHQHPETEPRKTHEGRDSLADLAVRHSRPMPVPTFCVATPSGGCHLYYRADRFPQLRNTIGLLGPRIDTRAQGGYVVAAGSRLRHGHYQVLDPREPLGLPAWLAALMTPPPPTEPIRGENRPHHPDAYVRAAVANQAARVRAAFPGTRHRTLLLAANSLGRLVGQGILARRDAQAALYDAAATHIGIERFTHAEAERTIGDGLDYAAQRTTSLA